MLNSFVIQAAEQFASNYMLGKRARMPALKFEDFQLFICVVRDITDS